MQGGSWNGLSRLLGILSESIVKGDELLREYVLRVSREYPRSTIVLFGSRARGDYLPYSDYDIAVIMEKVQDERDLVTKIRRLKPEGLPLDLLPITIDDLNDPVVRDMLRGCVVLYDGLGMRSALEGLGCKVRTKTRRLPWEDCGSLCNNYARQMLMPRSR